MRWAPWLLLCLGLAVPGVAQAPTTPAEWLQHAITQTLVQDPELNQYPLTVSVDPELNVTLNGVLPSPQDRKKAESLAHSVAGMNSLSDHIILDAAVSLSPTAAANPSGLAALQNRVQNALGSSTALASVTAHVYPGAVTLTGAVARSSDRDLAGKLARQAAPGWKLDNAIAVSAAFPAR